MICFFLQVKAVTIRQVAVATTSFAKTFRTSVTLERRNIVETGRHLPRINYTSSRGRSRNRIIRTFIRAKSSRWKSICQRFEYRLVKNIRCDPLFCPCIIRWKTFVCRKVNIEQELFPFKYTVFYWFDLISTRLVKFRQKRIVFSVNSECIPK